MNQIKLSPSKLNEFNDCPRCFYDAYTLGIKKPRGIFPGLPMGMDRVLKKHADKFRGSLIPALGGKVQGVLMEDVAKLKKWQNWRTGLEYKDEENDILLIGALDDCLVDGEHYIPFDWKTKGKKPEDDGSQYYQTQLDCYNLMLLVNGCKIREIGYLAYVYPLVATSSTEVIDIDFGLDVYKLECSIERAREVIRKAAECLRSEKRPDTSPLCEHCQHIEKHIAKAEGKTV